MLAIPDRLVQHLAVHEAGHATVGQSLGLPLRWVSINPQGQLRGRGLMAAGTAFADTPSELDALGAAQLYEVSMMSLAGFLAECRILGRHGEKGWIEDIDIMKRSYGWLEEGSAPMDLVDSLLGEAVDLVALHENAIRLVANGLLLNRSLSGEEVALIRSSR